MYFSLLERPPTSRQALIIHISFIKILVHPEVRIHGHFLLSLNSAHTCPLCDARPFSTAHHSYCNVSSGTGTDSFGNPWAQCPRKRPTVEPGVTVLWFSCLPFPGAPSSSTRWPAWRNRACPLQTREGVYFQCPSDLPSTPSSFSPHPHPLHLQASGSHYLVPSTYRTPSFLSQFYQTKHKRNSLYSRK